MVSEKQKRGVLPRVKRPLSFFKKMTKTSQKINKPLKFTLTIAISLFFIQIIADRAWASEITPDAVIELTNKDRMKLGVEILQENQILNTAAQKKLDDMSKNGYFAHTSPKGVEPWHWFDMAGYDYLYAGENLAINYKNVEDQEQAWMNSTTHRKNILNPKYADIGVAVGTVKIDDRESLIVVQMFGKQAVGNSLPESVPMVKDKENPEFAEVKSAEISEEVPSEKQLLSLQPGKGNVPVMSPKYSTSSMVVMLSMGAFLIAMAADILVAYRKRQEEGIMV